MMRTLKLLSCLLLLAVCAEAQQRSESCAGSPLLTYLSEGAGTALIKAYGYDLQEPWACTKIGLPWAKGVTILRFSKITVQRDDHTAFSVVKVPSVDYVWVIPTMTGMLEVSHAYSDPHNLAAFNALLRLRKGAGDAAGWLEAGKMYMTLLDHEDAISIKDETVPCSENECSVSFSESPVVAGAAYNKWTLTFKAHFKSQPGMLIDVSKETIRP